VKEGVMPEELGAWLRRQREARGLSRSEMARRLIQAGQASGDRSVPGLDGMMHNIYRWERGQDGLTERYKLYCCQVLAIPPARFGPGHPDEAPAARPTPATITLAFAPGLPAAPLPAQAPYLMPGQAGPPLLPPAAIAYRGMQEPGMGDSAIRREVTMAAHDGSDHAEQAEDHGIGDITFEQLRADLTRLSRLSDTGDPFPVFLDMRRVRARIYRLLDRHLWPREQTDLYFLLGCLNGLMGVTATRLGYYDAAEELIRAGTVYADAIDHRRLLGVLRVKLSDSAYWRGNFRQAHDSAAAGLEYLSEGPGGADLYVNQARAAARLGQADTARQAVASSHEAAEQDYSDDLTEIGGEEFAMSLATHHAMAGQVLADMPGGDPQAPSQLEHALGLFGQEPESAWFASKALAGVNLALVRLRSGALDAAAASLEEAFALPPGQRVAGVTTRLALARAELAAPVFRGSRQASELGDRIEDYGRDATAAGLRTLSDGPG
jgi:transcriptional regulator with XRE-family HTH domain/tetratricopeptide (TPR) repeat protein